MVGSLLGDRANGRTTARQRGRAVVLLLLVVASLTVAPTSAPAQVPNGLGLGVTPAFPPNVTVGDTALPASLLIVNNASGAPLNSQNVVLSNFRLNPSCASFAPIIAEPCPNPEPRPLPGPIFSISPLATGRAGTACAGVVFGVSAPNAVGTVTFTPSTTVVLGPQNTPGGPPTCFIDFTFDVLQRPLDGSTLAVAAVDASTPPPGQPGTAAFATAFGSSPLNSPIVVNPFTPALVTAVNPATVTVGMNLNDTAAVTGTANGPVPTGTVTFRRFFDPTGSAPCSGAPVDFVAPLTAGPAPAPGAPPTATAVSSIIPAAGEGFYRFEASYSGDANFAMVAFTACDVTGAAGERVTVTRLMPVVTTQTQTAPPGPVVIGSTVTDTATVMGTTGGPAPTGTVTFTAFSDTPAGTPCSGPTQVFALRGLMPGVAPGPGIVPTATAISGNVTTTTAGVVRFIAAYSGDTNYQAFTTGCLDANENVVVNKLTPSAVDTQAQAAGAGPVVVGSAVTDTATVRGTPGGPTPTGTVTFTAFTDAAGAAVCSGPTPQVLTPVTLTAGVAPGPGIVPTATATSPSAIANGAGTLRFRATYSGDDNYNTFTTACDAANENVPVGKVTPTVPTFVTPAGPIGIVGAGTVTDTATVTGPAGGPSPTGSVTFTVFADTTTGAACSATPTVLLPASLLTAGPAPTSTAMSPAVPITQAGTYRFTATYSGDANYNSFTTPCGAANENLPINQATPGITTSASSTPVNNPAVGALIFDTATVTGGFNPTGMVTFRVFRDLACATQVFTSTNPVDPATSMATSDSFATSQAGTYRFTATYNGDANNAATGPTPCSAAGEQVTLGPVQSGIVTTASPSVPAGGFVFDTATVTGFGPTGTVTFRLFSDANCTVAVGAPSMNPLKSTDASTSTATSNNFTINTSGTFRFVATYNGDNNNVQVTSACTDMGEQVVVTPAQPTILTQASGSVPAGGALPIRDVATVSAGANPTGTVTFTVFTDANCVGDPTFTSTNPLNPMTRQATSDSFSPLTAGTFRFVARYNGDANNAPAGPTGCSDANEQVTVSPATPAISTRASGPVNLGGTISDVATVTGGANPTGTVTFRLFSDANCTNQVDSSTAPLDAASRTASSGNFTVTFAGTFRFLATYNGDANNNAVGPTACDDAAERVIVRPANPTITTNALPAAPVGTPISDSANLVGGVSPTGTITFTVFGPSSPNCGGAPLFTSVVPVTGSGTYPSGPFNTPTAGVYRFVATYSGDPNNSPAGPTACSDPAEASLSQRVSPALRTIASPGVQVGGQISDTALLTGGFNPTGTITFTLFGPSNANCSGPPVFTSTAQVNGTGSVTSANFTTPAAGVFRFVAAYSGDANNNPVGPTACGDPDETVGAGISSSGQITTQASGPVSIGGQIADTATLSNTFSATGTITFRLFGPASANCAGAPLATSVRAVNGNGTYTSDPFTTVTAGTYRFVAAYSGDANNVAITTACSDPLEAVTVFPLPTIMVDKTALPESMPVPGGTFVFNVVVTNTSSVPVTITSLTDNIYGNITTLLGSSCNTAIGTRLEAFPGPGNTYSCRFIGDFRGPAGAMQTDTVTVTGRDDRNNPVSDTDDATVRLTPVPPSITTTKTPSPVSRPEPGGSFTFTYSVTNTGPEPVTVTSIVDDVYGSLNGKGTCAIGARLAANGGTYTCSFTGSFFGDAGATQTDTITTTAIDDHGQTVVSKTMATVTITDVPPTIRITKTPDPASRPEPGGSFRFSVVVTNTSFEPITTTSLVDDVYGDLNGRGTCAIGATLAANGGTYRCAFDGQFTGRGGDRQTDTVTVVAVDNDRTTVTDRASATVFLTPLPTPPGTTPPPTVTPRGVVPPTVTPPGVVSVQIPTGQVQQPLVRTGTDSARSARFAFMLMLVGTLMVLGARRFGFGFGDGGPGLAPVPSGPGRGPSGGGGASAFGGSSWFGAAPSRPWSGLGAGSGSAPLDEDSEEDGLSAGPDHPFTGSGDGSWFQPPAPPAPGPVPVLGGALGLDAGAALVDAPADDVVGIDGEVDAVKMEPVVATDPAAAAAIDAAVQVEQAVVQVADSPVVPVADVEVASSLTAPARADDFTPAVLVPTVIVVRTTGALDAVALDAAADMRTPVRPQSPAARRGPRRFGR